ncbi:MAG: isopenicillin N synthase family dioxygenase [bacterium]
MRDIPTFDLGRYLAGSMTQSERQVALAAVAKACEDHGFFLLTGHQCDALIEAVFAQSQEFFAQPKQARQAVYRDEQNPLGYYDRELTKQKRDQKEVFDFKAGGHQSSNPARQTRWPAALPQFKTTLTEFFSRFTQLSEQTMAMIFTALGIPEADIQTLCDRGFGERHTSAARLNYYPAQDPVPAAERDGIAALGELALHHHTDPGAITLLLQDDQGGLQALSKTDGWIDVPPQAGTIVVNVGDVLQVWTNDRCTAGVHRVLPVVSPRGRYSTPFFYQPRVDALVEPWLAPDETPHYHSFSWRDYIRGRVTDNFADYGESDIQIDRYRIEASTEA